MQNGLHDESQPFVFEGFNIGSLDGPQSPDLQPNANSQMIHNGNGQGFGCFDIGLEDLRMNGSTLASNTSQSWAQASPPVQSQINLGVAPPAPSVAAGPSVTPRERTPRFRMGVFALYTRENAETSRICTLCRKAKRKVSPSYASCVCTRTSANVKSA